MLLQVLGAIEPLVICLLIIASVAIFVEIIIEIVKAHRNYKDLGDIYKRKK